MPGDHNAGVPVQRRPITPNLQYSHHIFQYGTWRTYCATTPLSDQAKSLSMNQGADVVVAVWVAPPSRAPIPISHAD